MFRMSSILLAGLAAIVATPGDAQTRGQARTSAPRVVERPWIGFGVACSYCSLHDEGSNASWHFGGPPVVVEITPGGPAAGSGLAVGDTITAVNGVDIMSADGGRQFAQIKAGVPMRLWFSHGSTSGIATVVPSAKVGIVMGYDTTAGAARARTPTPFAEINRTVDSARAAERARSVQRSQFTGTVAGAEIEVRGQNVQVSSDRGTGKLIIQGDSLTVTVTVTPAGGTKHK
jgi:membrane-associated protease RseP (regulator of RpoE activity)